MIQRIKKLIDMILRKPVQQVIIEPTYLDIYENYTTTDGITPIRTEINSEIPNNISYTKPVTNDIIKTNNILNLDKLNGIIPDRVISEIPSVSMQFEINTPLRLAHFLAQCGHESGGFKHVVERLNYSAQGLANTWPRRFAVDITQTPRIPNQLANTIQRNEEKIANVVYASRMGNGILTSGDGWKFRGRGYIQLTGKSNYIAFNRFVDDDVVVNPDLVATKYPLLSAAWFFNTNRIHILADSGASRANVEAVTRRVNGGLIGIDHRLSEFERYYKLLS
jgi:putative chitinase